MEGWLEETQKERKKIGKLCVALTRVIKKKKDHSKKKKRKIEKSGTEKNSKQLETVYHRFVLTFLLCRKLDIKKRKKEKVTKGE